MDLTVEIFHSLLHRTDIIETENQESVMFSPFYDYVEIID